MKRKWVFFLGVIVVFGLLSWVSHADWQHILLNLFISIAIVYIADDIWNNPQGPCDDGGKIEP